VGQISADVDSNAQHDVAAWLTRWRRKYPKLTNWVEENIGSTLTCYRLPRQHHEHLKSTNMRERLNEGLRRRTRVVRIFPSPASCLRFTRALCVETHEAWLEDKRYINMDLLWELRKERLRRVATFLHNFDEHDPRGSWVVLSSLSPWFNRGRVHVELRPACASVHA
jgi:transposase-like protein